MSRALSLCFVAYALFAAAGCGSSSDGGPAGGPSGADGRLTFQIQRHDCVVQCGQSIDAPALAGSTLVVTVDGGDPSTVYTIKAGPLHLASATPLTSCTCGAPTSTGTTGPGAPSRPIAPDAACDSGETKSCSTAIELDTHEAGDLEIAVSDASGAVLDTTTVHLVAAASIESSVTVDAARATPDARGAYTARIGQTIGIRSIARDASGVELVYSRDAFTFSYLDATVVGEEPDPFGGSAQAETAVAHAAGTARVREVAGVGATRDFVVDVTP
jgi:hypothetical protein